jgi:hypothetical protein
MMRTSATFVERLHTLSTEEPTIDSETEAAWRQVLTQGHPGRWSFLPSDRRCSICDQALSGMSGKILNMFTGIHAASMTPNMCNI